jgi:hypothetical protein
MLEEFNTRKKEGLTEIKEKYNALASQINIDSSALQSIIRNHA